jgi:hypothetical protein
LRGYIGFDVLAAVVMDVLDFQLTAQRYIPEDRPLDEGLWLLKKELILIKVKNIKVKLSLCLTN